MSKRITVTLPDELDDRLPYEEYDSKSETVVEYVKKGFELEEVEAQRDDLRRQLQEANQKDRQLGEIVRHYEQEQSLQLKKHNASLLDRAKWFMFGGDEE